MLLMESSCSPVIPDLLIQRPPTSPHSWKSHPRRGSQLFPAMLLPPCPSAFLFQGGKQSTACDSGLTSPSHPIPKGQRADPAPKYLVIIIIQVGVSALQLHHLDLGHPVLFPLQHEVGVGILTDLLLMAAPVAPSVPPGAVEAPVLADRRRRAPVSTPELQEGTERGDR